MKALITGATSGIGRKMAEQLSAKGWDLILTGRNEEVLRTMEEQLPNVKTIRADLSRREDVFRVYEECRNEDIDMLVNNAGYGIFGRFEETDLEDELNMLSVNITALHILTKLFLRDFKKRNSGRILNVASAAGFMTGPLLSSYYASKNYVLRLTLAIYEELRRDHSAVTVTVLCPGPVDTNFNNRAGVSFSARPISAEYAAEYGLKKALSGKLFAVPGLSIKAACIGQRFVPHKIMAALTYNVQKAKKRADGNGRALK